MAKSMFIDLVYLSRCVRFIFTTKYYMCILLSSLVKKIMSSFSVNNFLRSSYWTPPQLLILFMAAASILKNYLEPALLLHSINTTITWYSILNNRSSTYYMYTVYINICTVYRYVESSLISYQITKKWSFLNEHKSEMKWMSTQTCRISSKKLFMSLGILVDKKN